MPTADHMTAIVNRYLEAINGGDMQAVIDLYSKDAKVEDPAGTVPKSGDEILEFYTNAFAGGAKVTLSGPVRLTERAAAFPFQAEITSIDGPTIALDVIDVFEFDDAGKIDKMTAYFGPANMTTKSD